MQTRSRPSPTIEAALSGFRLVWERPRAIALWAVVCFSFNLAEALIVASISGPDVTRILALAQQPNADLMTIAPLLPRLWPVCCVAVAATVGFCALLLPALNRAILSPRGDRFAYLRLGRDEGRQLGLLLVLSLAGLTVYLAMVLVASLIGAILTLAGAQAFGLLVAAVLVLAAMAYVWVRLSLASPATFATGRIDLAGAWRLTRGRCWMLARVYLVAVGLAGAVYLLGLVVIVTLAEAMERISKAALSTQPDLISPAMVLTAPHLLLRLLESGLTTLVIPVLFCPAVEMYRALGAAPAAPAPDPRSPWS